MNDEISIPPDLAARLAAFEKRLCGTESVGAGLAALACASTSLVALAALDRLTDVPAGVRVALMATAGISALTAAGWWAYRWLWRRRDARALARLVQRRYAKLGDRLLSAVELTREGANVSGMSPTLLRAALAQVERDAAPYDFRRAVSMRAVRRYGAGAALALAVLAIGFVLAPEALWRSVQRWWRPVAPVERYTFAQWADLPDTLIVPHGEPFEMECALAPRSRWRPARARARLGDRPTVRAQIRDGRALFRFPGQMQAAPLVVRTGDARRRIDVLPKPRPELIGLDARIAWPAYLQRDDETRRIERGTLALPAGTRVAFAGETRRALGAARLLPDEPLAVEGATFLTPSRSVESWAARYEGSETNAATLSFAWIDPNGLSAAQPYGMRLLQSRDTPPAVELEGAPRTLAALQDETLAMTVRAADDFGLAAMGLEWEILTVEPAADPTAAPVVRTSGAWRLRQDATGRLKRMDAEHRVALRLMEVRPGEILTLRAWSQDHYPGRARTRSESIRIHVLSHEEHAQQVRRAMAELSARLEEALREEERLLAAHGALETLDDDALALDRAEAMVRRGEESERANLAAVERLAQDADALMREALRNPAMAARDIQPWMDAAERLRQTAREAMAPAAEALARAQADERRAALKEAVAQERRAVDALRQTLQNTQDAMDQVLARSFVNRLRETARMERHVADEARLFLKGMAGLAAEELDPAQRSALAGPLGEHERARRETRHIRDDLAAFFLRTRQPLYNEVREAMLEPDVLVELDEVGGRLRRNQLALSAGNAERLAGKFDAWADRLDADCADCSGDGEGDGEQEGLEPDVLLGLMRVRVWEEMLREQTRAADEARTDPAYAETLRRAHERQREISESLTDLAEKTRLPPAAKFMRQLSAVSDEVAGLLARPESGPDVIAAQTEIIEAIAAAMQGSRDGSGMSESGAEGEQLAAAQQAGVRPGDGSGQGGPSVAVGQHAGPGSGSLETRAVERGGGDPAAWPAEYRDAIQRYYEAMARP